MSTKIRLEFVHEGLLSILYVNWVYSRMARFLNMYSIASFEKKNDMQKILQSENLPFVGEFVFLGLFLGGFSL